MPKADSSSSSSEDEKLKEQLKEAVATYEHAVITDNKNKKNVDLDKKKSKRFADKEEVDSDDFAPTPEFQDHVARKLRSKLDEYVYSYILYVILYNTFRFTNVFD